MRAAILAAVVLVAFAGPARAANQVTAEVTGRRLVVRGNEESNWVTITRGGATDTYVVTGVGGATVNGAASATFEHVVNITVAMGEGDDRVDLTSLVVRGEVLLRLDDGNDQLYMSGCTVMQRTAIRGDAGTDLVRADGSCKFYGSFRVRGDAGNDEILAVSSTFLGRVRLDGGGDDDHLLLQGVKTGPLARAEAHGGKGHDNVELLSSQFQNDAFVDVGRDDDRTRLNACQFQRDCRVFGGDGLHDVLSLEAGNTYARIRVLDGFEEGQP
jgi:hypothetical protein